MSFKELMLTILLQSVANATPALRETLKGSLEKAKEHARQTKNPIDDILIMMLEGILLGVEKEQG